MNVLFIKHIDIEGPGTLLDFLKAREIGYKIVNIFGGDTLPSDTEECLAIIILGGPMNVYEEARYPFLKIEDAFIRLALKKGVPMLGLCLGAQLLAKATGARVSNAPEKEIGWYKVNLTPDGVTDPIFQGLDREIDVFQWHGDTFDIPEKGALLASSRVCRNQAFRYGKDVYGLQFHLEVTGDMIREWLDAYADEIALLKEKISRKMILDQTITLSDSYKRQAERFCSNFFKIAGIIP